MIVYEAYLIGISRQSFWLYRIQTYLPPSAHTVLTVRSEVEPQTVLPALFLYFLITE